jgi:hypothetical protein
MLKYVAFLWSCLPGTLDCNELPIDKRWHVFDDHKQCIAYIQKRAYNEFKIRQGQIEIHGHCVEWIKEFPMRPPLKN